MSPDNINAKVEDARLITILALAKLAEYRDDDTGLHLERKNLQKAVFASKSQRNYPW
jgi:hypothetical protein